MSADLVLGILIGSAGMGLLLWAAVIRDRDEEYRRGYDNGEHDGFRHGYDAARTAHPL